MKRCKQTEPQPCVVNDVHSQLNKTTVRQVIKVHEPEEALRAVRSAKQTGVKIIAAGGQGAMGGQQFATDGILLMLRPYNSVLHFDRSLGHLTVGAGMNWTELYEWLHEEEWTFRQKQTGADFLTVGGAVSANAHGRGLDMKPFVDDVERLKIVTPDGELKHLSRDEDFERFKLVCGGYGLFGVIVEVTLRLKRRRVVERTVLEIEIDDLGTMFKRRIEEGYEYGDFQFDIDSDSAGFLTRGVFSCYRPIEDRPLPEGRKFLTPEEWKELLEFAHFDKSRAYDCYLDHYLKSHGQVYHCDEQQMSYYLDYYHETIDERIGCKGSEMITELYVPRDCLAIFVDKVRQWLRETSADVIYGTVRLIRKDEEAPMTWAKESYACLILNLHVNHSEEDIQRNQRIFSGLIDLAIAEGGSFYLTYHKWFSKQQLLAAYPQIYTFMARKRELDPDELFTSDWFEYVKEMVGDGAAIG